MATPVPPPADSAHVANSADALLEVQARNEAMGEELESLHELLAKPLKDILAERDKFQEAAAAWDAFGAMWLLSQRAMKRVALDLAAQQGVSADEVVARALAHANDVLNGDAVDLGGIIAPAQYEHITRHRALLRKQFRAG